MIKKIRDTVNVIGAVLMLYVQMLLYSVKLGTIVKYATKAIPFIAIFCFIWGIVQFFMDKKINVWSILFGVSIILSQVYGKSFGQFAMGLGFMTFIKDMDREKVFKIMFYTILSYMFIGIVLSATHTIDFYDKSDVRGNYLCLSFDSKHMFAACFTLLIMSVSYTYIKENYLYTSIAIMASIAAIFYMTHAKAIVAAVFLFPFVYYFLDRFEWSRKYVKFLPIVIFIVCVVLTCTLEYGEPLRTFKMRFVFPKMIYQKYGLKLFGYEQDLSVLTYKTIGNYFDNSYLYLPFQYGILSIPMFLLHIFGIKKNEDDVFMLSYLVIWHLISVMIPFLQNLIMFWPLYQLFDWLTLDNIKLFFNKFKKGKVENAV